MSSPKTSKRIHGNFSKVMVGIASTSNINLRTTEDEKEWFRQKSKDQNYKTLSDFIRCLLEEGKVKPVEPRHFPGNKTTRIRVRLNDDELTKHCRTAKRNGYEELSDFLRGLLAAA